MDTTKHADSRRGFIKKIGAAGLYASTLGIPDFSFAFERNQSPYTRLNPVKVSEERIIRQVVGLRPYRPSGFNLKVQKLDHKTVIHNYGHGGGGISLSWGTARLAIEMLDSGEPVAVLGSGVIGLSTAILLLKRGIPVTIYTEKLPPNTTSNVAAAFWAPVSVYDSAIVNQDFITTFNQASTISHRMFQDLVGARYGVRWMKTFFSGVPFDFPGGKNLYPDYKKHTPETSPFQSIGKPEELHSLLIEPPIYLKALLDDFFQLGGKLTIKRFNNTEELMELNENSIMNCTGLGSHHLFKDSELIPVKGQLTVLLPQEEINYGYVDLSSNDLLYMFPRKDGIILGGTSEKNNWSMEPDLEENNRILSGHAAFNKDYKK